MFDGVPELLEVTDDVTVPLRDGVPDLLQRALLP